MDIAEDIARLAKQNSARLVPESGPVGYYLRKTGPGPSDYEWVQGPRPEILKGFGDPNGVVEGEMGIGLYADLDSPWGLWQNIDGATAWQLVGTGASGTGEDLDYLQAFAATPTGIATDTIEHLDWTVDAPHTSGTAISVVANRVVINEPGIYSVLTSFGASAESGGDTYDRYIGLLDVEPNSGGRDAALMTDAYAPANHTGGHFGNSSHSWVGFLPAGAEFDVTVAMYGGGATDWEVLYGWIQVHQIANVIGDVLSGGTTFPITYNNGTSTYTIDIVGTSLIMKVVTNAGSVEQAAITMEADGDFRIDNIGAISIFNDGPDDITIVSDQDLYLESDRDTYIYPNGNLDINTGSGTASMRGVEVQIADGGQQLGFHGSSPVSQQTVTGSRGGNAALASLLTALDALGLIVDGSS